MIRCAALILLAAVLLCMFCLSIPSSRAAANETRETADDALPPEVEAGLAKLADPKELFIESGFAPTLKQLNKPRQKLAIERLKVSLGSKSLEVRRRAALLLGELGDDAGVPVMISDYTDAKNQGTDDNERGNLVVALRVLKDKRAIPALTAALDDPFPHVRLIALDALGELGAVEAFDKIAAHLQDKERSPKDRDIVMYPAGSACYALGCLGDRRAIPLLVAVLDDSDLTRNAAQALSAITKTGEEWDAGQWKRWWRDSDEARP